MLLPPVPPSGPPPRSRTGLRVLLIVLTALALVTGLADAGLVVARVALAAVGGQARFVAGADGERTAIDQALKARAQAVLGHQEAAFLAGVDPGRPSFVTRERTEYANLVALGLASLDLTVTSMSRYQLPANDADLASGFPGGLRAVAVTIRYAVSGLDAAPVAEPWLPVFGLSQGHWVVVDEITTGELPTGAGGLPWQAGPVTVQRTAHVTAVVSTDDQQIAGHLLDLAEHGVSNVLRIRSAGWSGKILVTAVSNDAVFRTYFRDDPEQVRQVAAIAVPTYDAVDQWSTSAKYVTTRVLFNPDTFGDGDAELLHTFTHEFTHAALGGLTTGGTPNWLAEGAAEYVAYSTENAGDDRARLLLGKIAVPTELPPDSTFYATGDNYVLGWLACRYLAGKYGPGKLFELYAYFHDHSTASLDTAAQAVLGVSEAAFIAAWIGYLRQFKK